MVASVLTFEKGAVVFRQGRQLSLFRTRPASLYRPNRCPQNWSPSCIHAHIANSQTGSTGLRMVRTSAAATDENSVDQRLPVTVLTGFLGSGKTTLLNNVLSQNHGRRIAIIENEFGSIDIDSRLIQAREYVDGVDIVESLNGCACCTVRGDLMDALFKLIANKKDKFDHIIIETTGLADPGPIISIFYSTQLADYLKVDGVVTMVDAKNVERHLNQQSEDSEVVNEALQQIAYADRIILNKTDLVGADDVERLEQRIGRINGLARTTRTQNAAVKVDYVIGVGGHDAELIEEELNRPPAEEHSHSHEEHETSTTPDGGVHTHTHEEHSHSESTSGDGHSHSESHESHSHTETSESEQSDTAHSHLHTEHAHDGDGHAEDAYHSHHSHSHSHHNHKHDDQVSSVAFTIEEDLDLAMVNEWLCSVLDAMANDLFRYKGILAIHGEEEQYIFQGVHEQCMAVQSRKWQANEKRKSQMVFIGRDIEDGLLEEGFRSCVYSKEPVGSAS